MDKKRRRFFAAAAVFVFLFSCFSLHALATDTLPQDDGTDTAGSSVEPPVVSDPPIVDDPTSEPPPVSSEPEPSVPSEIPSEPPVSSEPVDSEPSYVETPPPEQNTPEPTPSGNEFSEPAIGGATPIPTPTPRASSGTTSTATTPSSAKKGSVTRPKKQINVDGATSEAENTEPNYVTFATLNVKNNALAGNLFYGGLGCIAVGVLGLVSLLVLFLRNRRYARDEREGIFEEIQQAENRNRQGGYLQEPPERSMAAGAAPRGRREEDAPRLSGGQSSRQRRAPNNTEPLVPMDVPMYTEEFSLTEEQPVPARRPAAPRVPEERRVPPRRTQQSPASAQNRPAPRPSQPRQEPPAAKRFDTEEILREALHRDDDDF